MSSGNVLVLLNTLYTSGFASMSPTIPMLTSKVMHTLYASSFMIYSMNCIFQWLHIYCIMNGYLTSFPLSDWFVVSLVVVAVSGSMLCVLLVMLCVENAFAHRLNITPYNTGLAVIWEEFMEWVHSFNNFRVAFLFMVIHDMPISTANFFFISSCRCSGPHVLHWPLFVSTVSNIVSLLWRLVMLYFAYRRLIFNSERKTSAAIPARQWSFRNHIGAAISLSDGGRLREFDEAWPVRWSVSAVYGVYPNKNSTKTLYLSDDTEQKSFKSVCAYACSFLSIKLLNFIRALSKQIICIILIIFSYSGCFLLGCLPCLHFYTCQKNSFSHRHKCSKTFVKYCTFVFHYVMLLFSLVSVFSLLVLNVLLISSVHVFGSNDFPPEISKICVAIDRHHQVIHPLLLPSRESPPWSLISMVIPPEEKKLNISELFCKPLWENGHLGMGLNRKLAGPWQTRISIGSNEILAISTNFVSDYGNGKGLIRPEDPMHVFMYDFAVLKSPLNERLRGSTKSSGTTLCFRHKHSKWTFLKKLNKLGFPYFLACSNSTIRLRREELIDCRNLIASVK